MTLLDVLIGGAVLLVAVEAQEEPVVCIVGAGFAGLAAARQLHVEFLIGEIGGEIRIFEALDRVGGRGHTITFAGDEVEFGTEWILADKTTAYDYAKKNGLEEKAKTFKRWKKNLTNKQIFKEGGEHLDIKLIKKWFTSTVGFGAEKQFEKGEMDGFASYAAATWAQWEAFLDKDGDLFEREPGLNRSSYSYHHSAVASRACEVAALSMMKLREQMGNARWGGADWWRLSVHAPQLYRHMKNWRTYPLASGGFSALAEKLEEELPANTVRTGSRVANVTYDTDQPTLQLVDGTVHACDHVIVTLPIGNMKANHESFFQPPLATVYQEAMDAIDAGGIEKILAKFSSTLWDQEKKIGTAFLWDDPTPATEETLDHILTRSSAHQHAPNVFSFWITGPNLDLYYNATDEELISVIESGVATFLPGVSNTPTEILRSEWTLDPLFLGSFSNPNLNYDPAEPRGAVTFTDTPVLGSGNKPILMFAGEATSVEAFGTVHGAWLSGEREAFRIAEFYCRHTKKARKKGCK